MQKDETIYILSWECRIRYACKIAVESALFDKKSFGVALTIHDYDFCVCTFFLLAAFEIQRAH
jgi:hypothetical protein